MARKKKGGLWGTIQDALSQSGIDLDFPDISGMDPKKCKVILMPMGLGSSLRDMEGEPRDNVVMVRVDNDTLQTLDAWIETGAVKSRSEAAALFIREGLTVRESELEELKDALRDVERAKDRLRQKARTVLREDGDGDTEEGGEGA